MIFDMLNAGWVYAAPWPAAVTLVSQDSQVYIGSMPAAHAFSASVVLKFALPLIAPLPQSWKYNARLGRLPVCALRVRTVGATSCGIPVIEMP